MGLAPTGTRESVGYYKFPNSSKKCVASGTKLRSSAGENVMKNGKGGGEGKTVSYVSGRAQARATGLGLGERIVKVFPVFESSKHFHSIVACCFGLKVETQIKAEKCLSPWSFGPCKHGCYLMVY